MKSKCWTGRRWVNIRKGAFAIGFGPSAFIERIWFRGRLVYPIKAKGSNKSAT